MLLNFGRIARRYICGMRIGGQRRKLGLSDTHNPHSEMRCEIDASDKRSRSDDEVRRDGQKLQRSVLNGDGENGSPHKCEKASESQHRRA